jgi:hydrogenase maturation protease
MKETLILGLGNEFLSDDGIGSKIVHDLENSFPDDKIDYKYFVTGSLDLIDVISGYRFLVIVDAMRTRYYKPGNVISFEMKDYQATVHLNNFHDIPFPDSIKLAQQLEMDMPEMILIAGIEISTDLEFSSELSPELKTRYNSVLGKVISIISQHLLLPEKQIKNITA